MGAKGPVVGEQAPNNSGQFMCYNDERIDVMVAGFAAFLIEAL